MHQVFFPDPIFGWSFVALLIGLLATAAFIDLRSLTVPKWVTLPAMGGGLLFNVLRGGCLGGHGIGTWVLNDSGIMTGMIDGLLFALAGFLLGFVLFFLMWVMGACGGGDVKLFAAIGAWIGAHLALFVLGLTIVLVFFAVIWRFSSRLLRGKSTSIARIRSSNTPGGQRKIQSKDRLIGFSLPLALATALVMLWTFRVDLRFVNVSGSASEVRADAK